MMYDDDVIKMAWGNCEFTLDTNDCHYEAANIETCSLSNGITKYKLVIWEQSKFPVADLPTLVIKTEDGACIAH